MSSHNTLAVEMTRRIRDAHYEQIKDKCWEEQVAFYKEQARRLHSELKKPHSEKQRAQA